MDGKTLQDLPACLRTYSKRQEAPSRLIRLDDDAACCVLSAAAFMGRFAKMHGSQQQRMFLRLVSAGLRSETDLRSWLGESFSPVNARRWDSVRKRAEHLLAAGIRIFTPADPFLSHTDERLLSPTDAPQCPAVLFGKGCPPNLPPLLAVFNSRKPRQVGPESTWLDVLRRSLRAMDHDKIGLVGSTGTLTYDLASVLALRLGFLQLMVVPFALIASEPRLSGIFGKEASGVPVISCMLDGAPCPAKLPMRCRDRLVAQLADFHLVLEIRSRGNLLTVLEQIQSKSPRPQFVLKPVSPAASSAGNFTLLKKFPGHAIGFESPAQKGRVLGSPVAAADFLPSGAALQLARSGSVPWQDYLFHYTRACTGPWPGESYRQYLLELLDDGPLSRRSVLDTLVRIAQQGLLRASCRMVRSSSAVICWSSLAPQELFLMRKWHRSLARWTVEPYGVAVRRDRLRSLGAKPAIYASAQVYSKLPDLEKHRFQLSRRAPSASWRQEREWRIAGDLALGEIKPGQGFFFVQTAQEAQDLCGRADLGLPVIAIDDRRC